MGEDKIDKRERLLEAAMNVFSRKGYHQARIEEIADLAGVGKGTVYEYFSSKLELFQEMFQRVLNRYVEEIVGEVSFTSARERIRHIVETHLQFIAENRDFTLVTFGDVGGIDEEVIGWMYELRKEKIARLEQILAEGIAGGEFRELNLELTASILAGMMRGVVVPILMEGKTFDAHEVAKEVTRVLFEGIAVKA